MCERRRAVDADVREGLDGTNGHQWLNNARVPALCIYRIDVRYRSTTHCDRHRVEAGVAGFKMHRVMVLLLGVGDGPMMLVCCGAVMVFRMIVISELMDVQLGDLAGGRDQDQSEQKRNCAVHLWESM